MVDFIKMFCDDYVGNINLDKLSKAKIRYENGYEKFIIPTRLELEGKDIKLLDIKSIKEPSPIILKIRIRAGVKEVVIDGSIRKWYFGLNNLKDLSHKQFVKGINLIGNFLFTDASILWDFKISKIEFGCTVQVSPTFKNITNAYVSYKNFKKVWYENETSSFIGSSYTMSVYNKGVEIIADRNKKSSGSKKNPKPIKKLNTKATFVRYEMKITSMSRLDDINYLCNHPSLVKKNWNLLLDNLHGRIKEITYIDTVTPIFINELKGKSIKPVRDFFMYFGMEHIGVRKSMGIIEQLAKNAKKPMKEKLEELNKTYRDKPRLELEKDLRQAISRRVRKLKKK